MNKCLNCNQPVKNKYCNTSCQNKHQNILKTEKKYGLYKDFTISCSRCNNQFIITEREKLHPTKDRYFCSLSCANKRVLTVEIKNKISKSLSKNGTNIITKNCKNCYKEFSVIYGKRGQKTCSRACNITLRNRVENLASKAGLASVQSQTNIKRSKNEILFFELCKNYFNNILHNKPMFNGWDADIILLDEKIAILWNGKWHYEKITQKHSVEQVQNRDKIKVNEILKYGFKPYIIKDMGKYSKKFVNNEFEKLKDSLNKKPQY
jgi:hypothetical protein